MLDYENEMFLSALQVNHGQGWSNQRPELHQQFVITFVRLTLA